MKFEFAAQMWDTDKPVFVAGHRSRIWEKVDWYAYIRSPYGTNNAVTYHEDGVTCKKMWIKTIHLECKDGINSVKDVDFALPNSGKEITRFSDSFASHKRETAVADFLNSLKP